MTRYCKPPQWKLLGFTLMLVMSFSIFTQSLSAQAGCDMTCIQLQNISLGNDCTTVITSTDILNAAATNCSAPHSVTSIYDVTDAVNISNPITESQVGHTLEVEITADNDQVSCTGTVTISDELPPTITCIDRAISCSIDTSAAIWEQPVYNDNCGSVVVNYVDDVFVTGSCATFKFQFNRNWLATDNSGNTSTCIQTVTVNNPDLSTAEFDGGSSMATINCGQDIEAAFTQAQNDINVEGESVMSGVLCGISVSYNAANDITTTGCVPGGIMIQRTYLLSDGCGTQNLTFSVVREDAEAPTITCPASMTISTDALNCTVSNLSLDAPTVVDNCSSTTYSTSVDGSLISGTVITTLSAGSHTVSHEATDECGNMESCSYTITVEDLTVPIASCDSYTTVSLNNIGIAQVPAIVFNNDQNSGSYDNCTPMSELVFAARRMDVGGAYGNQVGFSCADLGDSVQVEVSVTDLAGNENFCMVRVIVQDKLAPSITCPANETVECTSNFYDLTVMFGTATALDNCTSNPTITQDSTIDISSCNVGTITRNFMVADDTGLTASCVQTIEVVNSFPFDERDIFWPKDFTSNTCGSNLDPGSLPTANSWPTYSNTTCALPAANYDDSQFVVSAGACLKIRRLWTVIDLCQMTNGVCDTIGQHVQIISLTNSTAPTIVCPADVTVAVIDCASTDVTLPPATATDDCSATVVITNNHISTGADASGNYPLGTTTVVFEAHDGCGNIASCSTTVTVSDQKKPTIKGSNISTNLMNTSPAMAVVDLADILISVSDNCSASGNILVGIKKITDPSTLFPTATSLSYDCAEFQANASQIIEIWAQDEAGNTDNIQVTVLLNDNMNLCSGPISTALVSGTLLNSLGDGVQDAQISVHNQVMQQTLSTTSDITGAYALSLPTTYDYEFEPNKNDDYLNGVTTKDMLDITKHLMGIAPFNTAEQIIAADINGDQLISASDLAGLRAVILHIKDEFPIKKSWRFIDGQHQFVNVNDPYEPMFAEHCDVKSLPGIMPNVSFSAIKVGDVNYSAIPNQNVISSRNHQSYTYLLDNETYQAGETILLHFEQDDKQIETMQMTINVDTDYLTIVDIDGLVEGESYSLLHADQGMVTIAMTAAKSFDLVLKAVNNGQLSNRVKITSDLTKAESTHVVNGTQGVDVTFRNNDIPLTNTIGAFQPNPLRTFADLPIFLAENETVNYTVYDLEGRVLLNKEVEMLQGHQTIRITQDILHLPGVYIYRVTAGQATKTGRLIRQ